MSDHVFTNIGLSQIVFQDISHIHKLPYNTFQKSFNFGWLSFRLVAGGHFGKYPIRWWYSYMLRQCGIRKGDRVLILSDSVWCPYWNPVILDLLQKKKCKIVLFFWDSLRSEGLFTPDAISLLKETARRADSVFTFDPRDAEEYGWQFTRCYYSKIKLNSQAEQIDVYCLARVNARTKHRTDLVVKVYDYLVSNGIRCKFYLYDVLPEWVEEYTRDDIVLNQWQDYRKVLEAVAHCNVILEVMNYKNQTGSTLRPFEAICYGKRLLTNYKTIDEFPFYDPEHMKYFSDVEDLKKIPLSFFKKRESVDYGYQGEFSPLHMLE